MNKRIEKKKLKKALLKESYNFWPNYATCPWDKVITKKQREKIVTTLYKLYMDDKKAKNISLTGWMFGITLGLSKTLEENDYKYIKEKGLA